MLSVQTVADRLVVDDANRRSAGVVAQTVRLFDVVGASR